MRITIIVPMKPYYTSVCFYSYTSLSSSSLDASAIQVSASPSVVVVSIVSSRKRAKLSLYSNFYVPSFVYARLFIFSLTYADYELARVEEISKIPNTVSLVTWPR